MPMAGVPWHSAQGYIQKLLKAGKKVSIGEQIGGSPDETDALPTTKKNGPKIVRREIVRQFTPGVQFDLEGSDANFLAVIIPVESPTQSKAGLWILACLDASTGECLVSEEQTAERLAEDLGGFPIRHLLKTHDFSTTHPELRATIESLQSSSALVETLASNYLSVDQAKALLLAHYEIGNSKPFFQLPRRRSPWESSSPIR